MFVPAGTAVFANAGGEAFFYVLWLTTRAAVAAGVGIGRDGFEKIDAVGMAAIQRWTEFAAADGFPAAVTARATAIQIGVANVLASAVTAKRGKRRKLWA